MLPRQTHGHLKHINNVLLQVAHRKTHRWSMTHWPRIDSTCQGPIVDVVSLNRVEKVVNCYLITLEIITWFVQTSLLLPQGLFSAFSRTFQQHSRTRSPSNQLLKFVSAGDTKYRILKSLLRTEIRHIMITQFLYHQNQSFATWIVFLNLQFASILPCFMV